MQFTEEAAKEIAGKFKLADATIATWRHRGKIPDKYNISHKSSAEADRILKALSYNKINVAELCRLLGIPTFTKLTDKTILEAKKIINEKRILVKQLLESLESNRLEKENLLRKFLNDPFFVSHVIFDRNPVVRVQMEGYKSGKRKSFPDCVNTIKTGLLIFLTETAI